MKYYQHGETGRVVATENKLTGEWYEIEKEQYEQYLHPLSPVEEVSAEMKRCQEEGCCNLAWAETGMCLQHTHDTNSLWQLCIICKKNPPVFNRSTCSDCVDWFSSMLKF